MHLTCFDTALLYQLPLSVMTLCYLPSLWRVSMFVFWAIAKSAVFPIIVVSKNKIYPEFILYGWTRWNSNVNILIFWDTDFWLSLALSSNHQNKKTLEMFYFTCNESKIYESFTFWNKLQEKMNFFTIFIFFLDVPVFMGKNLAVMQNSRSCRFLLKWLYLNVKMCRTKVNVTPSALYPNIFILMLNKWGLF